MAGRGCGIRLRVGPFGGVLPAGAVDLVEVLRLGVPRLELVVADRPGGRNAVDVLDLTEVSGPKAVERGAVQLGGPADEVVDLRLERRPVTVVPGVLRDVLPVDEHVVR